MVQREIMGLIDRLPKHRADYILLLGCAAFSDKQKPSDKSNPMA